jgi:Mlc titration factor MtfA (ptsG expression regulator)
VQIMVAEKEWEGGNDLEVSEEMKVTVSAQACVLIAGVEDEYYWDGVQTVIIHPGAYLWPSRRNRGTGIVDERVEIAGESWQRGPIVLSWEHVLEGGQNRSDGVNLVFHEFAHHLDGLDGAMEGTPLLDSRESYRTWYRVTEDEFHRLSQKAERGEATLLDQYGASDPVEFFAVSTECFFERPHEMRRRHRELYDLLCTFYRQDPSTWLPDTSRRLRRRKRIGN